MTEPKMFQDYQKNKNLDENLEQELKEEVLKT